MTFVAFKPYYTQLNLKKSRSMKKIYFLLLLSALTFQSAVAQNELQNPYAVAKEDGFNYRSLKKLINMDSLYVGSQFERPYHDLLSIL